MFKDKNGKCFKSTFVAQKNRGAIMYVELFLEISLKVMWVSSCSLNFHKKINLSIFTAMSNFHTILNIWYSAVKYLPNSKDNLAFHQNEALDLRLLRYLCKENVVAFFGQNL